MIIVNAGELPRKAHPDELANKIATKFAGKLINNYGHTKVDLDTTLGNAHINADGNVRYNGGNKGADYNEILRMTAIDVLKNVGYNHEWLDFSPESIVSSIKFRRQSDEIYKAQAEGYRHGDSRQKWGYYTQKTESGLPLSTELLENIIHHLDMAFKKGELPIGPDGKAQLSMDDSAIYKITLAAQEDPQVSHEAIVSKIDGFLRNVVENHINDETILNINTSGSFLHGGPAYDKGNSNTKCGVYCQSFSSLGGGPYGKDATKVELVNQIQAHLLAEELLNRFSEKDECMVLLDASIGRPETDILVWFNGSKKSSKEAAQIAKTELAHLLSPHHIIEKYLSDANMYDRIAEHGLLGGVLGEKYCPPFAM